MSLFFAIYLQHFCILRATLQQYKLGIKEKNILVVYGVNIDYFYSHYLNLIKK